MHYLAPAKLNLALAVRRRRPDGFHEIESIVCGVEWFDRLTARRIAAPAIEFTCDAPELAGEDNLAFRAAMRLRDLHAPAGGIHLHLEKHLPVAAGLGGGSSDAAAALKLCNHLWQLGLPDSQLARLSAEIGSDVPLFFELPSAKIEGRGERVFPQKLRWRGWFVLLSMDVPVLTREVYAAWRPEDARADGHDRIARLADAQGAEALACCVFNDLEPAVFRVSPRVSHVFECVRQLGFGAVRVSGAGSTFYLMADQRTDAEHTAERIRRSNINVRVRVVRCMNAPINING